MEKKKNHTLIQQNGLVIILLSILFTGCDPSKLLISDDPTQKDVTLNLEMGDEVYLWITSDKDTYVSCGSPSSNCSEQNINYGRNSTLVVANSQIAIKKSYVHFTLPNLPSGSQIKEAYLELFHSGKNEDGKSDDISIPVGLPSGEWSPLTLTYASEPDPSLPLEEFSLNLKSQAWSGTRNIFNLMQPLFFDSSNFLGFLLYWPFQSQGIEKGFYSNNSISRSVGDLGLAPRLLVKVHLPANKSVSDITLPPQLPSDSDLSFPGQQITMMQFAIGQSNWPDSWEVASIK